MFKFNIIVKDKPHTRRSMLSILYRMLLEHAIDTDCRQSYGIWYVSFMLGKARVAPLKQMTIPRMELAAAVLAVKVDKMLRSC